MSMLMIVNFMAKVISANCFVLGIVKFVIYAVIEIILKANVRHNGDKFIKQNVLIVVIMIMFLLMTTTMFI